MKKKSKPDFPEDAESHRVTAEATGTLAIESETPLLPPKIKEVATEAGLGSFVEAALSKLNEINARLDLHEKAIERLIAVITPQNPQPGSQPPFSPQPAAAAGNPMAAFAQVAQNPANMMELMKTFGGAGGGEEDGFYKDYVKASLQKTLALQDMNINFMGVYTKVMERRLEKDLEGHTP